MVPEKGIVQHESRLKLLFENADLGNLKAKNRIVMSPMGVFFQDCLDGIKLSPKIIEFYEARAKGGAGMIIVSPSFYFQMLKGLDNKQPFAMWDDMFIDPMRDLVNAVHKHDSLIGLHFTHIGSYASSAMTGVPPVSVSDNFINPWTKETPHELTKKEIKEVIANFAAAAKRIKEAGFDFIEYNAYSGYLIREFLSSAYNSRKDEYGGPIKNRLKFFKEVIYSTKEILGDDYPIIAKISGDEYLPGGNTWKEAIEIAKALERWGVSAIHVSPGGHDARVPLTLGFVPKGAFTYLSKVVKEQVKIPVITTHIDDLFLAEETLLLKQADFIAFGRQFLSDQDFPAKALNGKFEEIRPCIRCNQGCYEKVVKWQNVTCLMNPAVGRENRFKIQPVSQKKKIMVVGGGPGGLKCAQELAKRGHIVSLYERNDRLGGQMNLAAIPPGKSEFALAVTYLASRLSALGVKIYLSTEVTVEMVVSEGPDVVIISTGVQPVIPSFPGANGKKVVTAWDILAKRVDPGNRVVIIGGGGTGCETALYLAKEATLDAENAIFLKQWGVDENDIHKFMHSGKQVTILEMESSVAKDVSVVSRSLLRRLLDVNKIEIITKAEVTAVNDKGVEYKKENQKFLKEADTVVSATGTISENALFTALQGKVAQIHILGDAKSPRKALDAISEAAELAIEI